VPQSDVIAQRGRCLVFFSLDRQDNTLYYHPAQAPIDDLLLDIVDNAWRMEVLPFDQILVPREKLPDPEADGGDSHLTVSEQVS